MADERWAQIFRIYNDAAALAPVDRAVFLRKACGGDDALRAEIESLLLRRPPHERVAGIKRLAHEPLSGNGSAATRFARCWASAGWVKCIAPAT